MDKNQRKKLSETLHHFASIDYIRPDDIPNIDLYMDQVLTFLNQHLGDVTKETDEKPITKTMINNYSKNQLLPPPEKKKYSRDHMLNLIFIYYMKNFLQMKDIKTILDPINEKYFGSSSDLNFCDIYDEIVELEQTASKDLVKDVIKKYNLSREAFTDQPEEDQQTLQDFSFLCLLSFDVFVKKMIIEHYISGSEEIFSENSEEKESGKK